MKEGSVLFSSTEAKVKIIILLMTTRISLQYSEIRVHVCNPTKIEVVHVYKR